MHEVLSPRRAFRGQADTAVQRGVGQELGSSHVQQALHEDVEVHFLEEGGRVLGADVMLGAGRPQAL